jgi:hypothetical protein
MAHALSVVAAVLSIQLTACDPTSDPNGAPDLSPEQPPTTDHAAHLDFHRGKLPSDSIDATALGVRSTTPLKHPRVGQPLGSAAATPSDQGSPRP